MDVSQQTIDSIPDDAVEPPCEHKEAVKWNPYNQVVQCHRCGQIFIPKPEEPLGDDEPLTAEEIRAEGESDSESYWHELERHGL